MLKYLCIENIAVIEKAEIDFSRGFNVLTGETGAGKSIIIDSINAVLGERTSRDLIRKGCDKASVTAIFGDFGEEIKDILAGLDAGVDPDGNLLIARTVTSSGSTVRINGKTATVGVLKEIGKYLVDIHGQHDSQMLLNADNHCSYIDRMSGNNEKRDKYYAEFKNLNAIRKELNALNASEDEKIRRQEYLGFCVNELETAAIKEGEREELKEKLTLAENIEKTVGAINGALARISGSDETDGALNLVGGAAKSISALKSKEIEGYIDALNTAYAELESVSDGLRTALDSTESLATDKDDVAERLDTINRLIKKYGGSEEALFEFLKNSKAELERIETSDELKEKLTKSLNESTNRLIDLGEALSLDRKKTAEKFSRDVTAVLKYLDMTNVEFSVKIEKGRYTKNGCDVVEFAVKTNVGEDFKPLHKIASGGELSRIMLAIKSVLSDNDDVETMIFDEIDTGISGFAAGKVGKQLKTISGIRQIVCVTHLAQIAAFADNHIKIEKTVSGDRTYTKTVSLDYESRIAEIARIMSGTEITDNLYNSAKELLDRSKN